MGWLEQSNALHERVQAFVRAVQNVDESFEQLALEIAGFQSAHIPAYARLLEANASRLDRLDEIAAVPVEAFKLARVAAHPPEFDEVRFLTSGTTSGDQGQHCMRRTDTYRLAATTWGRRALVPEGADGVTVICL